MKIDDLNNIFKKYGLQFEEEYGISDRAGIENWLSSARGAGKLRELVDDYDEYKLKIMVQLFYLKGQIRISDINKYSEKTGVNENKIELLSMFEEQYRIYPKKIGEVDGPSEVNIKFVYEELVGTTWMRFKIKNNREKIEILFPEFKMACLFNEEKAVDKVIKKIEIKTRSAKEQLNRSVVLEKLTKEINTLFDKLLMGDLAKKGTN